MVTISIWYLLMYLVTGLVELSHMSPNRSRYPSGSSTYPPGGFSSYTSHQDALQVASELSHTPGGATEDEQVDIVGVGRSNKYINYSFIFAKKDEQI